jgi:GR25 family glycosyltransferase involved in LPS biosynthesis
MINEFFDKIYCINLEERVDRWMSAKKEMDEMGIQNVKRFSAIKNKIGHLGCRDSHIEIIKDAKNNGYKRILILEDDFIFINKDKDQINDILNQLNNVDWELFYFGATVHLYDGKLVKVDKNLVQTNFAYTTHSYAVNSSIYDFIIDNAKNYDIIDIFYNDHIVKNNKTYISNPMICLQRESYSNVENKFSNYEWMVDYFNTALNR